MLNLPENVRTFLQLHGGDTYSSQRDAAIRWYERTELISQDFSKVPSLSLSAMTGTFEDETEDPNLGASFPSKPGGKAKPSQPKKDMSTIECSGQIIATSHDRFPPNGGLVREFPLFQGNLGW